MDDASGDSGAIPAAPEADGTSSENLSPVTGTHWTHGRLSGHRIAVLGALVVLVGVIVAVLLLVATSSDSLGVGPGTATFSWAAGNNLGISSSSGSGLGASTQSSQSFSGDIEGHPVSGVATLLLPSSSSPGTDLKNPALPSAPIRFVRWKGTFAGQPFNLVISVRFGRPFTKTSVMPGFIVTGTWGRRAVTAHAAVPNSASQDVQSLPFHATVGNWTVTGKISRPITRDNRETETASFVVRQ